MAYRLSYNWSQEADRLGGWSENFWSNAASFDAAINAGAGLFAVLNAIHGTEASCATYRVSYVPEIPVLGGTRLGRLMRTGYQAIPSAVPTDEFTADYPSAAWHLNLSSGPGAVGQPGNVNRAQWIRGVSDASIVQGGKYVSSGAYVARTNTFLGYLQTGLNGIVMRTTAAASLRKPISQLFPVSGEVSCVGHGVPAGVARQVRISGVTTPAAFNGIKWVTRIDDDQFQILYWVSLGAVPVTSTGAWMRRSEYELLPIKQASIVQATSHYTGRPTVTLGGRRRRRRS